MRLTKPVPFKHCFLILFLLVFTIELGTGDKFRDTDYMPTNFRFFPLVNTIFFKLNFLYMRSECSWVQCVYSSVPVYTVIYVAGKGIPLGGE